MYVLAVINLLAFIFSVIVLWKTMRAAERQTERTSKPVLCLMRKNFDPSDLELLEPQLNVDALIPFRIRNVGNGTALVIHWRFKAESGKEIIHGMVPYLQTQQELNTGFNAGQLSLDKHVLCYFECEYLSLSQDKYRSVAKIENLKLASFSEEKVS